jgi:Flp pilus assembly protein TadG
MVTLDSHLRGMTWIAAGSAMRLPARAFRRGQAMVEFALIATLSMVVLLVGIQFAIIGQAALAVSQASYLGARAASVNSTLTSNSLQTAIANQISPTISGATVTLTNTTDATCTAGPGGTRSFGCPINVTVTYDATPKLFLPAQWTMLGTGASVITFPTNLTSTQSAMTE